MSSLHPAHRLTPVALVLAAAWGGPIQAADIVLAPVEVAASVSRSELEADSIKNPYRVESTARFGTEVMSREDIEALNPKDVLDLLDKAVGMNMTYQGRRSPFFLDERGGGNMTYILDGAVLPTSSNRILQKIPLAAIEQVEIIRGSTSLALGPTIPIGSSNSGSGINTGFVVIRTRQAKAREAEVSAFVESGESQPTANGQSLYAGTRLGDQDGGHGHVGAVVSRLDRPSKDEWFDGQDAETAMFTGGVSAGRFSANVLAYKDDGRFEMQRGVTLTGAIDASKWYYDPLKTTVMSADMTMAWSEDQVTLLSLFGTKCEQTEYNEYFDGRASLAIRHFEEKTRGYNLRHNARFGGTLVQLGTQYTQSEGFGPNTNTPYNDWKTSVQGWSASVEQKLLNDRVVLDAGYRRDIKHIDHSAVSATALAANSGTDLAPARTFTLGARWKINDMFALNGRYFDGHEGTAGDFDIRTKSGADLHAAEQKRTEVALEANLMPSFRPTLTWFDVDIKNQKTATSSTYVVDGQTYYYYTESDALRRGLELLIKGDIGARTSYSVAWTHMSDNQTTSDGAVSDALDLSSPSDIYTARLSHGWGAYRLNFSYKRVGAWSQSTSPMGVMTDLDLGNYDRIDANVARDFLVGGQRLTAKLYGRNLGNDRYATRYTTGYYYDRGRTIGVEVTAKF